MNTQLRTPTYGDYREIAGWVPDAAACKWWAGDSLPFPFLPDELPSLLEINVRKSVCLSNGMGPPLGFAQYGMRTLLVAHLCRIIVSPSERGKGLGLMLGSMLMDRAFRDTGASFCSLRVYRNNEPALALYRKLGFCPVEAESDADVLLMMNCKKHF